MILDMFLKMLQARKEMNKRMGVGSGPRPDQYHNGKSKTFKMNRRKEKKTAWVKRVRAKGHR